MPANQDHPLSNLPRDGRFLFLTRVIRLFAYGALSVILVLYLAQIGLSSTKIGLLLTLTPRRRHGNLPWAYPDGG